jgi:hypothetical protein
VVVDEIYAGVDRLHSRAVNINEETTIHKVPFHFFLEEEG